MKVCKFGGTSLADANQIRKMIDIVLSDPERKIVVVSAPGKRNSNDVKVTDMLIKLAKTKLEKKDYKSELATVVERYSSICNDLGLSSDVIKTIEKNIITVLEKEEDKEEYFIDAVKATGEDNCAYLIAKEFIHRNIKARYLSPLEAGLFLSEEYGNAQVLPESYENLNKALKGYDGITVFPGFFGYTRKGRVVTFSRGGSDITGSILAAAAKAELYENFTDVDSVFAVDPSIIQDPVSISELTYREMRELSYAGFKVLHEEAILPTALAGIPICIKNTNNPKAPGTLITPHHKNIYSRVVGIASDDGFATLYIEKILMNREIGFGRKVLQIFEDENIPFEHMPSGIDNLSIILRESFITSEIEKKIYKRLKEELKVNKVELERGLSIIMIVGEGMRSTVGMAALATAALAEAGVNIEMINQGSSEISMMFGVKSVDRKKAVKALYKKFFEG